MHPPRRLLPALLLLALCAATTARAQSATPTAGSPIEQITSNRALCEWYRASDRLDWDVVTPEIARAWESAIALIAEREKIPEAVAERRLAEACRAALPR